MECRIDRQMNRKGRSMDEEYFTEQSCAKKEVVEDCKICYILEVSMAEI